jgi:hypothetical protein
MENSFIVYTICVIIIVILILVLFTRSYIQRDCQCKNYRKDNRPLKYIPKKIFQLVADKNNIHPKIIENIQTIKNMNPEWKYTLYDDNDMIEYLETYYSPEILYYYNKINQNYGAAKADFFRYLLMYREGGVYLDIKSGSQIPLDNIIGWDDQYILSHWDMPHQINNLGMIKGEYQQWHIICRPNHPYLLAVINKVISNIKNYSIDLFGVGKTAVLKVTGPIAYTQAIFPIRDNYSHKLVASNEFIYLVYNNIDMSYIKHHSHHDLYGKTHYSKIKEPLINDLL